MPDQQRQEDGWPSRAFDDEARAYLLTEARQRVQEQLSHISALDVKTAALFTVSAVLFTASGLVSGVRWELTPLVVPTFMAFFTSLVAWACLGRAYWTRNVGVGIDLRIIREDYARASASELRDAALESAFEDFILNQQTISSKTRWLRRSFFAVAAQLVLLFASIVVGAAGGSNPPIQNPPVGAETQSGTTSFDGAR